MLRDAGVRTKLLAVLAIPTLLLAVVTGLLVSGQVAEARRAGQVAALTEVAIQVNRVVHALQDERQATLVHLEAPAAGTGEQVRTQRATTDQQLTALDGLVDASTLAGVPESVGAALARAAAGHAELTAARASVDAGRFFATEADVFYSKVIRADLDLPGVVAGSGTADLARSLQAYQDLTTTTEYAAHERDIVEVALRVGSLNEAEYAQTVALTAQQRQSLQDFQAKAGGEVFSRLDDALAAAANFEIDQVRRDLPELLQGAEPDAAGAQAWVEAAGSRIAAMTTAEAGLVADIGTVADATRSAQERRALVLVTVAVLGLGLAAMLAVTLARRITRPLRRLTVAAGEIGDELPRMVERMQTPGEGPGVVVEPIRVESADEIGRLAEAFNTVNDVTVQVAREQAALRASIAEMFVNVARRNQVLLGRQLKALDAMEAGEEDPEVLARLFTLDHLATRMRRNAESLLVLAGIDSTRRLRSAVPLSDVIRTAVGEIEAYDRIDLSMTEDPDVSGRHALTVAHLLAELLENATHFSNPETRVVVSATRTGTGVAVSVTDHGLGMSQDEVLAANRAIASPPVAEIAVSQRLGHFVVGRLAARLGAEVELRRGRAVGTVVTVALPASVFEGLVLPEPEEFSIRVGAADEVASDARAVDGVAATDTEAPELPLGIEPVVVVEPVEADLAPAAEPAASAEAEPEQPRPAETEGETDDTDSEADADGAAADDTPDRPDARRRGASWLRFRRGGAAPAPVPDDEPAPEEPADHLVQPEHELVPVHVAVEQLELQPVAEPEPVAVPVPEPVAVEQLELQPVAEPEPVAAVQPEPEPVAVEQPEPEPVAVEPEPEPVAVEQPEPVAEVEPEPALPPVPAFAYAPAVDILPGRPAGRRRRPAPEAPAPRPATVTGLPSRRPAAEDGTGQVQPTAPPPVQPTMTGAEAAVPTAAAPADDRGPAEAGLASSMLSELRGLYEPSFAPSEPSAPSPALVRRTPRVEPVATAATAATAQATSSAGRHRNPAEVRGMLSGFRAGVARGRGDSGSPEDPSTTAAANGSPEQQRIP